MTATALRQPDRARRSARWPAVALLVTAVVDAAAAMAIGGVLGSAPRFVGHEDQAFDVDVAVVVNTPADAPSVQAEPSTAEPTRAQSATRDRHATRPTHRRLNPSASSARPVPPPRFSLSAGTVAMGPASVVPNPVVPNPAAGSGAMSIGPTAFGEADVNVPARLLTASPLVYPPAARNAEIEIDVPVDIVVDAAGRVASARVAIRSGYGLDDSALRAVRDYRFSPAIRNGRPVPVRMRWTVQFRLR